MTAAGTLTVIFDVAQQAFLPSLVKREHLTGANEQLEASRSLGLTLGMCLLSASLAIRRVVAADPAEVF